MYLHYKLWSHSMILIGMAAQIYTFIRQAESSAAGDTHCLYINAHLQCFLNFILLTIKFTVPFQPLQDPSWVILCVCEFVGVVVLWCDNKCVRGLISCVYWCLLCEIRLLHNIFEYCVFFFCRKNNESISANFN